MSEDTANALIKSAIDFAAGDSIAFAFQGGEPLIAGIDYFKNFVAKFNELNVYKSQVYFSIQTNGMLVNEE